MRHFKYIGRLPNFFFPFSLFLICPSLFFTGSGRLSVKLLSWLVYSV